MIVVRWSLILAHAMRFNQFNRSNSFLSFRVVHFNQNTNIDTLDSLSKKLSINRHSKTIIYDLNQKLPTNKTKQIRYKFKCIAKYDFAEKKSIDDSYVIVNFGVSKVQRLLF